MYISVPARLGPLPSLSWLYVIRPLCGYSPPLRPGFVCQEVRKAIIPTAFFKDFGSTSAATQIWESFLRLLAHSIGRRRREPSNQFDNEINTVQTQTAPTRFLRAASSISLQPVGSEEHVFSMDQPRPLHAWRTVVTTNTRLKTVPRSWPNNQSPRSSRHDHSRTSSRHLSMQFFLSPTILSLQDMKTTLVPRNSSPDPLPQHRNASPSL